MRFLLSIALQTACVCAYTAIDAHTNKPIDTWPMLPHKLDSASLGVTSEKEYVMFTTSIDGQRFQHSQHSFEEKGNSGWQKVEVDVDDYKQTMEGIGGAITDAAIINLNAMNPDAAEAILHGYYGPGGIKYSIGRVPIASCDFSDHVYSYDDMAGDFSLSNFTVSIDDTSGKVDMVRRVLDLSHASNGFAPKLFASVWSAPAWMKESNNQVGGKLIGTAGDAYHKAWALYFKKFLDEYEARGIKFWGLTTQNEPQANTKWQNMKWDAASQRDFVKTDLGPLLKEHHPDVKIMIYDDQRLTIRAWVDTVMNDLEAAKYVSGVAFHWYTELDDTVSDFGYLADVHNSHPGVFLLASEACEGSMPWSTGVKLGLWSRGGIYGHDILQDLEHWAVGWTDWNIVLDMDGGVNWANNVVDAPIIADIKDKSTFYVQPMYYYLGHFSAFIPAGSVRIGVKSTGASPLEVTGWKTPVGDIVLVAVNRDETIIGGRKYQMHVEGRGYINVDMPKGSIQTIIFKGEKAEAEPDFYLATS